MDSEFNNRQQILDAFDEHWEKFSQHFDWRIQKTKDSIQMEAHRQLVNSLQHKVSMQANIIRKMEAVFSAVNINPREHALWSKQIPYGGENDLRA